MTTRRSFLNWRNIYNPLARQMQGRGGTFLPDLFGADSFSGESAPRGTDSGLASSGLASSADPMTAGAPYLEISRRAMAADFVIYLNAGQYGNGKAAALDALDIVTELEKSLSYFIAESQVSEINTAPVNCPVFVDDDVFDLIRFSIELSGQTDGAFDITSSELWELWGFARKRMAVPSSADIATALPFVGVRNLVLDLQQRSVARLTERTRVNLGSIGKGYALDRSAEYLFSQSVSDFLIHGGNSSVVARGNRLGEDGWKVGLHDPLRQRASGSDGSSSRLQELVLRNAALATSGAQTQFFRANGKRYGHIIDPRTGYPASGVYSSTVVIPLENEGVPNPFAAAEADALATAFYILGPEKAQLYCQNKPMAVFLVMPDEKIQPFKIVKLGDFECE